jgi:hypothetical protein
MLKNKIGAMVMLVFMPVFISVDLAGGLSFSRPGAHFDSSQYIVTFPISLVFISLFLLFNINFHLIIRGIVQNRINFFAMQMAILYVLGVIFALISGGFSGSLIIETLCFFCLIYIVSGGRINIPINYFARVGFWVLAIPGLIAAALVDGFLIPAINFLPGEIIPGVYAIYNFEQYYAMSLVLTLGFLMKAGKSLRQIFICFLVTAFVAHASENSTALLLALLGFFLYIVDISHPVLYRFFIKTYFFLAVILFILFPIISYLIVNSAVVDLDSQGSGFIDRMYLHAIFLDNFRIENIFIPATASEWFRAGRDVHHQFVVLMSSGGVLCAISYYLLLIYIVIKAKIEHRFVFISLCLVAATMVEPLNHPFLMIQFFIFLGASYYQNSNNERVRFKSKFKKAM